jgi:Fic family protein
VGYNSAFLNDYQPNANFYLPATTRAALLACGQAVNANEPAGTYARQIASRLLIDLSWNSSRLEGNTYSLLETKRLLQAGYAAEGKTTQDGQMILNHKEAIEFLIANASEIGFNRYTLLNLHALLSDNLLADPTASTILDPFEQAFLAMVHLPYLQPFEDVNKRVSRLAVNIPLIQRNQCPLSFVDVPQDIYTSALLGVYESTALSCCATCLCGHTSAPAPATRPCASPWASLIHFACNTAPSCSNVCRKWCA